MLPRWINQFSDSKENCPPAPIGDGWDELFDVPTETKVAGKVVQLHRMRPACHIIGRCLALTAERECEWFPTHHSSLCRERL